MLVSSSGEELEDWRWLPPAVCWLTLVHPLSLYLPLQDCHIKCQGRTLKLRGFFDYAEMQNCLTAVCCILKSAVYQSWDLVFGLSSRSGCLQVTQTLKLRKQNDAQCPSGTDTFLG